MIVLWPNGSRTAPTLGSGYGPRESFWTPGGWTNPFHYGQDCFGFPLNRSVADGVVTYVGYNGGFGNFVRVRHDDGYSSGYAHGAPGGFRVSVGQRVAAGTPVSVQGTTGRSTGVHLHFEVYDPNGSTIDPAAYVRARIGSPALAGGQSPEEDDMYANDPGLQARLDQIVGFIAANFEGLTALVKAESDEHIAAANAKVDEARNQLAGWTRDDANSIRGAISGLSVAGTDPAKIAAAIAPLIPAGASAKDVADELARRIAS